MDHDERIHQINENEETYGSGKLSLGAFVTALEEVLGALGGDSGPVDLTETNALLGRIATAVESIDAKTKDGAKK